MMNIVNIISILIILLLSVYCFVTLKKEDKPNKNVDLMKGDSELKSVSYKLIVPLKIQAYERLVLFIEDFAQ